MTIPLSISATALRKRYGDFAALDGFDLAVARGSIHGLLGPNGAGKTTAVRSLATLLSIEQGDATVAGFTVGKEDRRIRTRIGVVGQTAAVDEILTGRQNLVMFGRLYGLSKADARRTADALLTRFDLSDAAAKAAGSYSGGMRRRLDIAAALILRPEVLFLDEPTTGLDPRARNEVWRTVRSVADAGTTVLLTTQYLDEADQLADRISVMNHGRVVAEGTPDELKRRLGADRVVVTIADLDSLKRAAGVLQADIAEPSIDPETATVTVEAADQPASVLMRAVRALDAAGVVPDDITLRRPTLDEAFLAITASDTPNDAITPTKGRS